MPSFVTFVTNSDYACLELHTRNRVDVIEVKLARYSGVNYDCPFTFHLKTSINVFIGVSTCCRQK